MSRRNPKQINVNDELPENMIHEWNEQRLPHVIDDTSQQINVEDKPPQPEEGLNSENSLPSSNDSVPNDANEITTRSGRSIKRPTRFAETAHSIFLSFNASFNPAKDETITKTLQPNIDQIEKHIHMAWWLNICLD